MTVTRIAFALGFFAGLALGQPVINGNYAVGQLPSPIQVYLDQSISINLTSPYPSTASSYTATVSTAPKGKWGLNSASSSEVFTYVPDPADTTPFTVTFSDLHSQPTVTQAVTIQPLGFVRPDADFVQPASSTVTAAPDDSNYLNYLETCAYAAAPATFIACNGTSKNPVARTVEYAGHTITLSPGQSNGYYEKLNYVLGNPPSINGYVTTLTLYADTVIITGGRFWVPSANVTILARQVIFQDAPTATASQMAVLDTSGIAIDQMFNQAAPAGATGSTPGAAGKNGNNGGNVTIHAQQILSVTSTATAANGAARVVLSGGAGQKGGLALAGTPGTSVTPAGTIAAWTVNGNRHDQNCNIFGTGCDLDVCSGGSQTLPAGYTNVDVSCEGNVTEIYPGYDAKGIPIINVPTNGNPAIAGGKPGVGGNGGNFVATAQVLTAASVTNAISTGGPGGASPPGVPGGAAGTPNPASALEFVLIESGTSGNEVVQPSQVITYNYTAGAPFVPYPSIAGQPGTVTSAQSQELSWLHPISARIALDYMNDAFKARNLQLAGSIGAQYLQYFTTVLTQNTSTSASDIASGGAIDASLINDFSADQAECTKTLALIRSNRDIYGNPAGYVPLLSLAADTNALTEEVNADGPLLYLANWLTINAQNQQANANANMEAQAALLADIKTAQAQAATAQTAIDNLTQMAVGVNNQMTQTNTALLALQNTLTNQATTTADKLDTPSIWQKALQVMATVATVIPVGQPELGAVGAGLTLINSITSPPAGQSLPSTVFQGALTFATTVAAGNLAAKNDDLATSLQKPSTAQTAANTAATINTAVQGVSTVVNQVEMLSQPTQAPQDQINNILQGLEAQDPSFQSMITQIQTLNASAANLAGAISTATDSMAQASHTINADLLTLAALQQAATQPVMNMATVSAVNAMGTRAKARLQKYLYYVAKSYEYNLLQPYTGDLNLDTMSSNIQAAINTTTGSGTTTGALPADLGVQAVLLPYQQAIQNVYSAYNTGAQGGVPSAIGPYTFSLSASDLATLNSTGQVVINLSDKLQTLIFGAEKAQLTDIAVAQTGGITVTAANRSVPVPPQVSVYMYATGDSVITSSGNLANTKQYAYKFTFNSDPTKGDPIFWEDTYNTGPGTVIHAPKAVQSTLFLSNFLGVTGVSDTNLSAFLFTYPSAETQIRITQADVRVQVTALTLSASVNLLPGPPQGYGVVSVRAPAAGSPVIAVSAPDLTGRATGQLNFKRVYTPGSPVTLTAPLTTSSGLLTFQSWANLATGLPAGTGSRVTETVNGPALTFTPTASGYLVYQPVYSATGAQVSPGSLSISGTVSDPSGLCNTGVTLTLTGGVTVTSASDGTYSFPGLAAASYTVTPAKTSCTFAPPSIAVTLSTANSAGNNFTGTAAGGTTTLTFGPSSLPGATLNAAYSAQLTASGGTAPYSFTVVSGGLPTGLTLSLSGSISGTPTQQTTATFTIQVKDAKSATAQVAYTISVTPSTTLTLGPPTLPPATLNAAYSAQLTASGGTAPYSFTLLSGNLPTGLSMPTNGLISGTPTQQSTASFTIQVKDSNGLTGQLAYTLAVTPGTTLTFTPSSLPTVILSVSYSAQLTVTGGTPPYTFSVLSGSLPAGLTLSPGGLISGTPTQAATTASFTVQVKDANSVTGQMAYTLTIGPNNCTYNMSPPSGSLQISGGTTGFTVSTQAGCQTNIAIDDTSWIHATSTSIPGGGSVSLSVDPNNGPAGRASVVGVTNAAGAVVGTYAIAQSGVAASLTGLTFVSLSPCRVMDTRTTTNPPFTGSFGPPSLTAGQTRTVNPSLSTCGVPATAKAYVTNVTLLPQIPGRTNSVTIYPADEEQPRYTTASAADGNIVANAAIIRTRATDGAISLYSSDTTDVLIDIAGYFTDNRAVSNLVYYPLTPCRVVETRAAARGPGPFGGPSMAAGETRQYQFPASPNCPIPSGAAAYSMTLTAVPQGPLFFLTVWPAGISTPPTGSSLNSFDGRIVANAVIVPASTNGSIQVYSPNPTDFFIDINGYFAPDDGKTGLSYYPVTQCTAASSADELYSGVYGDGEYYGGARSIAVPASPFCASIPPNAQGFAVDLTANPHGNILGFITLLPTGAQVPTASMLNDFQKQVVTNSAFVPAGPNGSIDVFTNGGPADIQVMISGYFSR